MVVTRHCKCSPHVGEFAKCDYCNTHIRPCCKGVTDIEYASLFKNNVCRKCVKKGNSHEFDGDEFVVDKIIKHKAVHMILSNPKRKVAGNWQFFVKWMGLDERHNSWVSRSDLSCPMVFAKYFEDLGRDPPFSDIPERFGAGPSDRTNQANWLTKPQVVEFVKKADFNLKDRSVPILDKDEGIVPAIILNGNDNHLYVEAITANGKLVADGLNLCKSMAKYESYTKVEYLGQTGVDHCASSAAIITLYFMKFITTGVINNQIVPKRRLVLAARNLHAQPSNAVTKFYKLNRLVCPDCGKTFPGRNPKRLNTHRQLKHK